MSASSLKDRLNFMGIGPDEIALLRELKPVIERALPDDDFTSLAIPHNRWQQRLVLFVTQDFRQARPDRRD